MQANTISIYATQLSRPAFLWSVVYLNFLFGTAIVFMLLIGRCTIGDATAVLSLMVTTNVVPATAFVYGRTQERKAGVTDDLPQPVADPVIDTEVKDAGAN